MNKPIPALEVKALTVNLSGKLLLKGIDLVINKGEHLAVIGASGSGKTTLINALAGNLFAGGNLSFAGGKPNLAVISEQHRFKNRSNLASFYYQQRFNASDSQDAVTVKEELLATGAGLQLIAEKLSLVGISHIDDTRLLQLSNGEHKRFQIVKALLKNPEWLLLDSPYTGLDAKARIMLNELIDRLAVSDMQIILVSSFADMPQCITQVNILEQGAIKKQLSRDDYEKEKVSASPTYQPINLSTHQLCPAYHYDDFTVAIKMVATNVVYDNRKILDNIHWEVRKGERWSVSGHNGSGKSTLLSLVNGDNPQAFANEIYLFDRRKGSGETIWDIKQKIGYVSPELHHYFDPGSSCSQVVASGLFDTIGLFRQLNASQQKIVEHWMELFKIKAFSGRLFNRLSNGEQRLVLLARALVKNPPLLILDEPCQGLDKDIAQQFISLINDICIQLDKTLIYVSHYEEEIPPCVTRSLKLEQGRIAA